MKGFCFLDLESKLNYRTKEFIDDSPGFWQDNADYILMVWPVDTEDNAVMLKMYQKFKALKLKQQDVLDFTKSIGYSIEAVKAYADSLQSTAGQGLFSP